MRPGSATAFEALVDDYDAARPTYPASLYAALPPFAGRDVLELGAGTGLATAGLRDARLVLSDLGPNMLRRAVQKTGLPAVVAQEAMTAFGLERLSISPWALREGVILRRLDWLAGA